MLRGLFLATLPFGIRALVFDLRLSAVSLWPLAFGLAPSDVCVNSGVGVGDSGDGGAGVFGALLTGGGKRNIEKQSAGSRRERSQ